MFVIRIVNHANLKLHEVKLGRAGVQHRVKVTEVSELTPQDIADVSLRTGVPSNDGLDRIYSV